MWTDTVVFVGDRAVRLSIERLAPARRDEVAAAVAWLAIESGAPSAAQPRIWTTLVEDVLAPHMTFTIDGDAAMCDATWWGEALRQATSAFVRVNELEELILRSCARVRMPAPGWMLQ